MYGLIYSLGDILNLVKPENIGKTQKSRYFSIRMCDCNKTYF